MYYIRTIHISRPAQHHHHRSILLVEYSTLEVRLQQTSFYFSEGRVCHLLSDVVAGLSIYGPTLPILPPWESWCFAVDSCTSQKWINFQHLRCSYGPRTAIADPETAEKKLPPPFLELVDCTKRTDWRRKCNEAALILRLDITALVVLTSLRCRVTYTYWLSYLRWGVPWWYHGVLNLAVM